MRLILLDSATKQERYVVVPDSVQAPADLAATLLAGNQHPNDADDRNGSCVAVCVLREGPDVSRALLKAPLLSVLTSEDVCALREDDTVQLASPRQAAALPPLRLHPVPALSTLDPSSSAGDEPRVQQSSAPVFGLEALTTDAAVQSASVAAFVEYGHFFVDVPIGEGFSSFAAIARCNDVAAQFFDTVPYRNGKWRMPMDPDDRTWGWHCMHDKQKEILKLRDVPSMHGSWPGDAVPWAPFEECMTALRAAGELISTSVVTALGVDPDVFRQAISRGSSSSIERRDEFTASFYELFRYAPCPASKAGGRQLYMPCEAHQDVGIITVSLRARGPRGLELLCPKTRKWVAAEPMGSPPVANEQSPEVVRLVVFAGDGMAYVSRGIVKPSLHRVVLPTHADNDPNPPPSRYSTIYEVLAHPQAVVPRCPEAEHSIRAGGGDRCSALTGRDLFVLSSVGKSSINWK
jgi:isopenicillin N synthase-like dioxygenase